MLKPVLAQPIFRSGPLNTFATQDAYAAKQGGIINSIQDLAKEYNPQIAAVLRGAQTAADLLPLFTTSGSGFPLNKQNLMSRLLSGNRDISTYIRQMETVPGFSNNVFSSYNENADGSVFAKVGDITKRVAYTDFKSMSDIGYLINDLSSKVGSGVSNLFSMDDEDGTVGFLVGTIKEATKYGIPNSFSSLMGVIENSNVVDRVVGGVLPDAVRNSDLDMVQDMAKICSRGSLVEQMPDIFNRIGSSYQSQYQQTAIGRLDDFTKVTSTFDSILPDWNNSSRNGESIPDLTRMQFDNSDLRQTLNIGALRSDNLVDKLWLVAEKISKADVFTKLKESFPMTVLTPDGENPQTDPRNLSQPEAIPVAANPPLNISYI